MQIAKAGPSACTGMDTDDTSSSDPHMEPKGWYSEEYYYYTPEEVKQQEKIERRRLEREANNPPPLLRATGSMGKIRYIPTAKKPAAKPVSTNNRFGLLTELETDYWNLPWFQPKSTPKPKKPTVDPKDYITFDEYTRRQDTQSSPSLVQTSEASIELRTHPLSPVPGTSVELVSKPPPKGC